MKPHVSQLKPKFKKVKLKQPSVCREIEAEHNKHRPNPINDRVEKMRRKVFITQYKKSGIAKLIN